MSAKDDKGPDTVDQDVDSEPSKEVAAEHAHDVRGHKPHNQSQLPGHHANPAGQRPSTKAPGQGH